MEDSILLENYRDVYEYIDRFGIHEVRKLARAFGIGCPSTPKKHVLIMSIIRVATGISEPPARSRRGARVKAEPVSEERIAEVRDRIARCNAAMAYREWELNPTQMQFADRSGSKKQYGYGDTCFAGYLEINKQGVGVLRGMNCESSEKDPVLSDGMIKNNFLKEGDLVNFYALEEEGKSPQLLQLATVNGREPYHSERKSFEEYISVYPQERLDFSKAKSAALRALNLVCPLFKGQRGLILAPMGAGKTSLLMQIAEEFTQKYSQHKLLLVLPEYRMEEITEFRNKFPSALVAATPFDAPALQTMQAAKLALEVAKRAAESGKDVLLLVDSVNVLARAYMASNPPCGVTTRGGVDMNAMQWLKKYFNTARNLQDAGTLTMLATGVTETSNWLDEDICFELLGAANLLIRLQSERAFDGVFPSIEYGRCTSKRSELLQSPQERARAKQFLADAAEKGVLQALSAAEKGTL